MRHLGGPRDEPATVPVDPEAQQRELEAAGWEQVERMGKVVWRHPTSGGLYPQGPAMRRLRIDQAGQDRLNEGWRGQA